MQARLTTRPEQDVIAAIQALDLESVKRRVMDPELGEGWTQEYADSIETAYRNYLTMLVKYPDDAEDIMLSKDVDEFWHTHILQTRKYTDDCQRVFGNYLHHEPHVGDVTAVDIERRTILAEKNRQRYEREFGGAHKAAYCAASIGTRNVAYCAASAKSEKAAYCAASIKSRDTAYCAASVGARNAAYCAASAKSEKAAYCAASIKSRDAAYCAASIGTAQPRTKSSEPMVV